MIGYFDSDKSTDFTTYHKVSSVLRDDCSFHAAIGYVYFKPTLTGGLVVFVPLSTCSRTSFMERQESLQSCAVLCINKLPISVYVHSCWLGGRKGIWPVKTEVGCWRGCLG